MLDAMSNQRPEMLALKRKHFNTGETEIGELKEDAFKMMRINAECERI
jgi:hypothetical protein|tara:strand:- start:340 stop:483 length:144 start_codon:yes stop_codon:yes gene_type:complete